MIFSLDVIRARKGDCLLLHYGSEEDPGLMLIDGGPSDVFEPELKPRIEAIKQARGLGHAEPLPLDLLLVSHVDDDHIRGILDLTRELQQTQVPLVEIADFWHNSFDELLGRDPRELTSAVTAQYGPAALSDDLGSLVLPDLDEAPEVVSDTFKILASLEQGHRLKGDIQKLGASRNAPFGGKLVLASSDIIEFDAELSFVVAGPMQPELRALQRKHDDWLRVRKASGKQGTDAEAAYVDKSVPNLSSIVVLARCEERSILLTGDARGDKILEGLEMVGLLKPSQELEVDVLKVPHHGSSNNLESDFFQRVLARHYVFSGDGEHGNPERETLEMLFEARGKDPFTIHLTYPVSEIDIERKKDWNKERGKEEQRAAKGSAKPVREHWSAKKHSLAAFFEQTPLAHGQRLVVSKQDSAHVIDLLDELGY